MAKPNGPLCNLDCAYCYYLGKKDLLPDPDGWRMSDATLERFIHQNIHGQDCERINFSWQGGEPTLLGIEFFEKAVRLQAMHCPPTRHIDNDIQTNGTLLDEAWCRFFRDNHFLVGVSIDGPADLHNAYRYDKNHQPTFDRVVAGIRLLQQHQVEFNTLTVVNRVNARRPLDVYRFLRDQVGIAVFAVYSLRRAERFSGRCARHWDRQGMPTLDDPAAHPGRPDSIVTDWSVDPDDYGEFLCVDFRRVASSRHRHGVCPVV